MANGRPTPYQAFGAFYDRIKDVIDNHGWHPFQARTLGRRDKKLSLLILNPNLRGADEPSASEIGKATRAALKVVHPDLLTGSPELISADPAGLKTCLEEATQARCYIEKATSALTPGAAWEPNIN